MYYLLNDIIYYRKNIGYSTLTGFPFKFIECTKKIRQLWGGLIKFSADDSE